MLLDDEFRDGLLFQGYQSKDTPLMNIDYLILHDTSHPQFDDKYM